MTIGPAAIDRGSIGPATIGGAMIVRETTAVEIVEIARGGIARAVIDLSAVNRAAIAPVATGHGVRKVPAVLVVREVQEVRADREAQEAADVKR